MLPIFAIPPEMLISVGKNQTAASGSGCSGTPSPKLRTPDNIHDDANCTLSLSHVLLPDLPYLPYLPEHIWYIS